MNPNPFVALNHLTVPEAAHQNCALVLSRKLFNPRHRRNLAVVYRRRECPHKVGGP
jgi:hypothetical protein